MLAQLKLEHLLAERLIDFLHTPPLKNFGETILVLKYITGVYDKCETLRPTFVADNEIPVLHARFLSTFDAKTTLKYVQEYKSDIQKRCALLYQQVTDKLKTDFTATPVRGKKGNIERVLTKLNIELAMHDCINPYEKHITSQDKTPL